MSTDLTAHVYVVPQGYLGEHPVTEINEGDAQWFKDNDIVLSIEQLSDKNVVAYARKSSDNDCENEVMILANGRDCQTTMQLLREEAEERFS